MNKDFLIRLALHHKLGSQEELEGMEISELRSLIDNNDVVFNNLYETRIINSSVDQKKRTVELEFSHGTKGKRNSIFGSFFEELVISEEAIDLKRLKSGAPLLAVHDQFNLDSVIGVVEDAFIEGEKAVAIVRFAKDEISERIFQKVIDGILKNVSVGYTINEWEEIRTEDSDIPTIRVTKWEPGEISIVPVGFDHLAQIRSQKEKENKFNISQERKKRMDKELLVKLCLERSLGSEDELNGMEIEKLQALLDQDIESKKQSRAAAPTPTPAPKTQTVNNTNVKDAIKAEQERCLQIRTIVKDADLKEDLAEAYIKGNHTIDEVRFNVELFKKHQTENADAAPDARQNVGVQVGTENQDQRREGIINAVLHGQDPANFKISEQGREFAGMSLLRMMSVHLERQRHETDVEFVERTMTSSDLPNILSNVASKTAQMRYQLAPKTFEAWTSKGTLKDYKESTQLRSGDIGSMKPINEKGEYEQSNLGEEFETAQLTKYGVMHSFSDIMLINDDLDMIMDVAREAGVSQARLDNQLAYIALTSNPNLSDGIPLFDAQHGNLGTAGSIGETTFDEAFSSMRKQKTVDKRDFINVAPAFLVCGPDQETAAKKFLADIQPEQSANVNPFSNSVQLIVDAELTGNQYYFVANPMLVEGVKLNRLRGQESVRVSSRVNWKNDAIELKLSYAVQAKAMDYRGLFKNDGQ